MCKGALTLERFSLKDFFKMSLKYFFCIYTYGKEI